MVQRRGVGIGAAVARDQVQLCHRHVELGVAGVLQVEELGGPVAEVHRFEAEVTADAMLEVHHRVADAKFR